MAIDILSLRADALPDDPKVVVLRGREAISQLYRFEIDVFAAIDPSFDMLQAIGSNATLEIHSGANTPYEFHGILASLEHVQAVSEGALYRLTLVPRLYHLTQTEHSRVFINQSVPDIIETVLQAGGLTAEDYRLALQSSYVARDHVCQYHESDLAFIQRWMERDGIYFFFEQGDEREVMVITDHRSVHSSLRDSPLRYEPYAEENRGHGEGMYMFRTTAQVLPQSVTLNDYNFHNPELAVTGNAPVSSAGRGAITVYGENFLSPAEGRRLASVRAEELLARQQVARGNGRVFYTRPGYTFTLDGHPTGAFNVEYVATEIEHFGNQSGESFGEKGPLRHILNPEYEDEYRVHLVAIPSTVQFRPERKTPKPRIYGMEIGIIDGPANSPYAQIDADGCYKVKVKFDESGLDQGGASLWVRMLQPHGGTVEGCHFPLRKGTEVMLTFEGGDPDRPVIAGMLHNPETPSPVTSANSTKNVLQTGGHNRIEMEDQSGSQYIRLSTPTENSFLQLGKPDGGYNINLGTDGDGHVHTGRTYDVDVDTDHTAHVKGEVTENYDKSQDTTVKVDHTLTVGGDHTVDVAGDHELDVDGDQTITVKGELTEKVTKDVDETYSADHTTTVTKDQTITVKGDQEVTVKGDQTIDVTGDLEMTAGKDVTIKTTGGKVETVNGKWFTTALGESKGSLTTGIELKINIDATLEIGLGISTDIHLGAILNLHMISYTAICLGLELGVCVGAAIEMNAGAKIDLKTAHLYTKEMEIGEAMTAIKEKALDLISIDLGLDDLDLGIIM